MKKVLLSMAAVGALAAATPAIAQYGTSANAGGTVGFSNRIAQLDARLRAGIQAGEIDRAEARSLRWKLRQLTRLERQYSVNGLTQQERQDLRERMRAFRQEIRLADGGRFDNDNRYGNWQDDDYRTGQYGNRADSGIRYDRYGNRDDRYGEYDRQGNRIGRADGNYGQGGPYEEPYACEQNRSVIGGVLDTVLGRNSSDCASLRVGARASGNLYSVPSQYRSQYRDGNGVYYRSDGRVIYQIDARTDTVLRIYTMDR